MFTGLIRSVSSPLIQVFARYHARDDKAALMKLLNFTSLAITVAVLALAYWSTQLAGPLFQWWIGPQLARVAVPVFALLIFANGMRLWCAPYVNYLVGVGLQREIYLSPIVEGIANLGASIVLAIMIGAIGVAWGTVIGAVLGVGAQYFYNFPRTMPADFRFRNFFNANILAPLVVTAPMLGVLCLTEFYHVSLYICGPAMAAAFIPSMIFVRREYGRTIKGLSREAKSTFEQEIPELASSDT
jgi:O-antigen/teichoic acid export membrane protein